MKSKNVVNGANRSSSDFEPSLATDIIAKPGDGIIPRSKSDDAEDFRIKVVQYAESDVDLCLRYYEEDVSCNERERSLGYNYHDFSHSTWYDYTREKIPMPVPIQKHECDDIRLCLPLLVGPLYSLKRCTSGILTGWGFTAKPCEQWNYYITEMMSGILCGMTILPEIISFAFLAGVRPHLALHGTWILCLFGTIFGGSPGIITGVSGAFAAVAGQYSEGVSSAGYEEQFARMQIALMISGALLILFSFAHLASLSQFISTSVIIGYSNGLAIIIAKAQFHGFEDLRTHKFLTGPPLYFSIFYCILAFILMQFSNHIPKIGKYVPSALLAIVVVLAIHYGIVLTLCMPNLKITTVGDVAKLTTDTRLPGFFFIEFADTLRQITILDMELAKQVCVFTATIMLEAIIIADVIKTLGAQDPNSNQQFWGLGIGNFTSAICSCVGGSSMIGISVMNFKMGARGKESNLFTGLFLFIMMVGGYPMLNFIPIPCLSGIMFSVSCHCFKWFSIPMVVCTALPASVRNLHPCMKMKITRFDALIILSVTLLCVFVIIPVALLLGIVMAAFAYVWESKKKFKVEIYFDNEANIKYYEIEGNVFYASKRMLTRVFTPETDPATTVVVLLASTTLFDYTAIEAFNSLKAEYAACNKALLIKGLSHGCIKKVAKMNHLCRHMEHDLVGIDTPNLPTLYSRITKFKGKFDFKRKIAQEVDTAPPPTVESL